MLTALLAGGLTCEYCHLNGLSYEISQVDKVSCACDAAAGGGAAGGAPPLALALPLPLAPCLSLLLPKPSRMRVCHSACLCGAPARRPLQHGVFLACHRSRTPSFPPTHPQVFLGAASVLSNGTVLSRVGTAAVATMAAAHRVPGGGGLRLEGWCLVVVVRVGGLSGLNMLQRCWAALLSFDQLAACSAPPL